MSNLDCGLHMENVVIPNHTKEKLDKLSKYYALNTGALMQEYLIDRIDQVYRFVFPNEEHNAKVD